MTSPSRGRISKILQCSLVALGSLQLVGFITGLDVVRNLGSMTNASPLPLVFSTFRGIEPFSSAYAIRIQNSDGGWSTVDVTPATYSKLGGPYNYRNVYGAAFAFGARLETDAERKLFASVVTHGFLSSNELRVALGISDQVPLAVEIIQTSRARGISGTWTVDSKGNIK